MQKTHKLKTKKINLHKYCNQYCPPNANCVNCTYRKKASVNKRRRKK